MTHKHVFTVSGTPEIDPSLLAEIAGDLRLDVARRVGSYGQHVLVEVDFKADKHSHTVTAVSPEASAAGDSFAQAEQLEATTKEAKAAKEDLDELAKDEGVQRKERKNKAPKDYDGQTVKDIAEEAPGKDEGQITGGQDNRVLDTKRPHTSTGVPAGAKPTNPKVKANTEPKGPTKAERDRKADEARSAYAPVAKPKVAPAQKGTQTATFTSDNRIKE